MDNRCTTSISISLINKCNLHRQDTAVLQLNTIDRHHGDIAGTFLYIHMHDVQCTYI